MNVTTLVDDARRTRYTQAAGQELTACFQCGVCSATCPVRSTEGMPVVARQLMRKAQLGLDGTLEDVWRCTGCRLCESRCPRGVDIVGALMGLRSVAFEEGHVPAEFHKLLWSVLEEGNPSGGARRERAAWARGLPVKEASAGTQVLLYVGCAVSYDARLQKIARNLVQVLNAAGVNFGILGTKERCCGDAVRATGERGYLGHLIESNVKAFQATGASTLVTVSPHCYDVFRNLYPRFGLGMEVLHVTELLERLIDKGSLKPRPVDAVAVAYHDPCYLGRWNHVYEAPRKVLESIPGVRLVEFGEKKSNALCCGGGGGGMWRADSGERPADERYRQATVVEASTLATACPYCVQNFEDSARRKPGPNVVDVTELLATGGR